MGRMGNPTDGEVEGGEDEEDGPKNKDRNDEKGDDGEDGDGEREGCGETQEVRSLMATKRPEGWMMPGVDGDVEVVVVPL